jgi:hypothetical protein
MARTVRPARRAAPARRGATRTASVSGKLRPGLSARSGRGRQSAKPAARRTVKIQPGSAIKRR